MKGKIMDAFKEKLCNQKNVIGTMISEISTPNLVRMLKSAGYEFVFVDCEHGYFDFNEIANITSVGNGFGIKVIVRVPSVQREFITKVMDIGVDGLLLSQIDTVQQAKDTVQFAKYAPLGQRGISTTRAHTGYHVDSLPDYLKTANDRTVLLAQIESREAVANSLDIASVEGIDGLIIGPNDMAAESGIPGQVFAPEIKEMVAKVIKNCKKAGKSLGIVDGNIERLHYWQSQGMNIFCIGSEVHMILKGAKENMKAFKAE